MPKPIDGAATDPAAVLAGWLAAPAAAAWPLEVENALMRVALEQMPHGLCMFDGNDRLVLANRHYLDLWGLPEALGRPGTPFSEIMAATHGRETEQSRAQPTPAPGSVGVRRREWLLEDGRTIEIVVTRLADGSSVALHEDITEKRRSEAKVAWLARHDPLTGLPNRSVVREELERMLSRNARGEDLAVLCLDLDRFKAVNDTFGHPAGDALLRQVGERLRGCARETDLVVRLGGDEFAILQGGTPQPASSTALARRIIASLSRPFELDGHRAHIGSSVGIAVAPFDGDDAETLLKNADLALYRAKAEGRGTLRYFEPGMDSLARERRTLEADLRVALANGEFHLEYQPQIDVEGSSVSGFEALLRWTHPLRGPLSPMSFIPLAEETGLIVAIGRWVLRQACHDAMRWPGAVRVAVNVSAAQFTHNTLLQDVTQALADSGLPPARLELEITESVLLQDQTQAVGLLTELRSAGVRVAMDDFGTGYSSLSYLRSFPFDRIKIDRSFVRDVETNPDARSIIRAVAGLGHSLGMATPVEGVETLAQLAAVRGEGCGEVQGYLFSRPRPAAEVPFLIDNVVARGMPPSSEPPPDPLPAHPTDPKENCDE